MATPLPVPPSNPEPSTATTVLSHAELTRILGPNFEQHLGLLPNTFLPELTALAHAVRCTNGMGAESIGKVVHGIRYERCKSAWSRGETDVDAEVIARDLVDAAKEFMQEVKQEVAGNSAPIVEEKKPSPPAPLNSHNATMNNQEAGPSRPTVPTNDVQTTNTSPPSQPTPNPSLPPPPVPTTSTHTPTTTTLPSFPRNSQAHADEQFLIKSFNRRNFREYLHIAPADVYHSNLKTLAINMVDLEKSAAEIREMLVDAREERLRKARSEKERGKRVVQGSLKESVTSSDVRTATIILQREAAMVWKAEQEKRKREEEEEERRSSKRAKSQHADSGKAKAVPSSARNDKPTRTPTHPMASGPFPPARKQSPSERSQPRARPTPQMQSTSHRQPTPHAQPTPVAKPSAQRVNPPPSPQQLAALARAPETIPLEPMDELMLSSFQSLATHAPRALKQGQEMTMKIGRKADGSYWFTHFVEKEGQP